MIRKFSIVNYAQGNALLWPHEALIRDDKQVRENMKKRKNKQNFLSNFISVSFYFSICLFHSFFLPFFSFILALFFPSFFCSFFLPLFLSFFFLFSFFSFYFLFSRVLCNYTPLFVDPLICYSVCLSWSSLFIIFSNFPKFC